jgi:YfiH family protein
MGFFSLMSISFSVFERIPGIRYGLSERSDGSLRLNQPYTRENRDRYLQPLGLSSDQFVSADLVHGTHVHLAGKQDAGKSIAACDGLITADAGVFLCVTGADCFPIYLADPVTRRVGLAHAGWRGISAGIASIMVETMIGMGSDPSDLVAGIGPGIRVGHFEVGEDVAEAFSDQNAVIRESIGLRIHLPMAIQRQLVSAGMRPESIEDSQLCTVCQSDRFFSYRHDKPNSFNEMQAMMAWIGFT